MEQRELLTEAATILFDASSHSANGRTDEANAKLAELRELLIHEPQPAVPKEPEKPDANPED